MYSLFKSNSSKKLKFKLSEDVFYTRTFKIIVILISMLLGVLKSDLIAQDSFSTLAPGKIAEIFTSSPKVILSSNYDLSDTNTTHLKMSYGGYKIINKDKWQSWNRFFQEPERVVKRRPIEVDIVMTLYPSDTANWRDDFYELIKNRVIALEYLDSAFLIDKFIKWNIYLQNNTNNYSEAKKQFHGIVVHYKPLINAKQQDHYASLLQKWDENINIKIAGKKLNKIIDRNRTKWKNMLVITDCSGSMRPYGTEVMIWHLLRHDIKNISQFVFFNDDANIENHIKQEQLGNAGGVYVYQTKRPEKVVKAISYFTKKGLYGNRDVPENDVEAIIKGSEMVDKFDDIILIADNLSPVRDISLVKKIKKPVRIVLCGVYENQIHPHYFKLAHETNGSIHTIEEDIDQFIKTRHGQIIPVNDIKYILDQEQLVQMTKKSSE